MAKTLKLIKPCNPEGKIVVVMQSPDDAETAAGEACKGKRGDIIKALYAKAGFDPDDLMFIHAYPHPRVEFAKIRKEQIEENWDWIDEQIGKHKRKAIIVMGNAAAYAVGATSGMTGINSLRGRPYLLDDGTMLAATGDTYSLSKEPEKEAAYLLDLSIAHTFLRDKQIAPPKFKVHRIKSAKDVRKMYRALRDTKHKKCAYDYETDCNRPIHVTIASLAFCIGKVKGVYQCYIYVPEIKMVPQFDKATNKEIRAELSKFFDKAGSTYDLIAHNANFDDWITYEQFPKSSFSGSQYDSMIDYWVYDNLSKNGLKEMAIFMGYPNYEEEVDKHVKETTARRGKALTHPEDFKVAERFKEFMSLETSENKKGETIYKWPKSKVWGTKTGAWAMLPEKILVDYNCLDVVMTWKGEVEYLRPRIEAEGLVKASKYRHEFARMLLGAERWGFRLDVKLNREWSKKLRKITKSSLASMKDILRAQGYKKDFVENLNPNSSDQLITILFGESVPVPQVDAEEVCNILISDHGMKASDIDYGKIKRTVQEFHNDFYADQKNILKAHKAGTLDAEALSKDIKRSFYKRYTVRLERTVEKNLYIGGEYMASFFTDTGKPSTSRAVIEMLADEHLKKEDFLYHLLMWRRADKARGTFVDGLYDLTYPDGCVRPHYNSIGTNTGRISSSNPNGQNLNRYLRGQCIPREGNVFVEFDLSQAEIRVIAALSKDKKLLKAIYDADNGLIKGKNVNGLKADTHTLVAAQVYKVPWTEVTDYQRKNTKTVVFGTIYGISAYGLAKMLHITVEESEELIQDFFDTFKGVKDWIKAQIVNGGKKPFYARTVFGTRRSVKNLTSIDVKTAEGAGRVAANMPVQGTAGEYTLWLCNEIIKEANSRGIYAKGREGVGFNNTTHDSGCFEVAKKFAKEMEEVIRYCAKLPAPFKILNTVEFKVDTAVNTNWAGKPSLIHALDPALADDKGKMKWNLLDPSLFDDKEYEELKRQGYFGLTGNMAA